MTCECISILSCCAWVRGSPTPVVAVSDKRADASGGDGSSFINFGCGRGCINFRCGKWWYRIFAWHARQWPHQFRAWHGWYQLWAGHGLYQCLCVAGAASILCETEAVSILGVAADLSNLVVAMVTLIQSRATIRWEIRMVD